MVVFIFSVSEWNILLGHIWSKKNQNCQFRLEFGTYNPGHNILELYNILVQAWFPTSKTKLDI